MDVAHTMQLGSLRGGQGKTYMTAASIRVMINRKCIAGLFIPIPAIITILVIARFFRFVDGFFEPIYYHILSGGIAVPHRIGESGE